MAEKAKYKYKKKLQNRGGRLNKQFKYLGTQRKIFSLYARWFRYDRDKL